MRSRQHLANDPGQLDRWKEAGTDGTQPEIHVRTSSPRRIKFYRETRQATQELYSVHRAVHPAASALIYTHEPRLPRSVTFVQLL